MDICKKKQKKVGQEDHKNAQPGDCYAYIAIKRDTKLHLAHTVGKRIDTIADYLVWKLSCILSPPTFSYPLKIYTDGNPQYLPALLTNFRKDCIVYGRLIKYKRAGKLVWKVKEQVLRYPKIKDIDTTVIENYNGILRERISRLVRRGKCFSKNRNRFENHLNIFQSYNNLMKSENGKTPMILEGKTSKIWCWNDFFNFR